MVGLSPFSALGQDSSYKTWELSDRCKGDEKGVRPCIAAACRHRDGWATDHLDFDKNHISHTRVQYGTLSVIIADPAGS